MNLVQTILYLILNLHFEVKWASEGVGEGNVSHDSIQSSDWAAVSRVVGQQWYTQLTPPPPPPPPHAELSWPARLCHNNLAAITTLSIERLRLTSPAVKQPKRPPLYSVSLIRLHGKKAVISTVISETQAARNLRSTTVSTITEAQLPCRLDRAATRPRVQVSY